VSSGRSWTRIARRDVLKTMAAAGLAGSVPMLPALAQDKPASQPVLAELLARYAASLKYEDIPDDVVRIAKRTILDTIGCAFGGYGAGPSRIAIKLASDVSAKQPATVLISGTKTSADLATFVGRMVAHFSMPQDEKVAA